MPIRFFTEDISYTFKEKKKHRKWLSDLIAEEGFRIGEINYVFCSDDYLYQINLEYLEHDTYTDIITFDQSDATDEISGDVFISIDRIEDNASQNQVNFKDELRRVMAHGILHLMGYNDKSKNEAQQMRKKENIALKKYSEIY
jgi:probable rRNA maturation factor